MKTVFLRLLDAEDKAVALRTVVSLPEIARGRLFFEVDTARFSKIYTTPFSYWAPVQLLDIFGRYSSLGNSGRIARMTNPTTDDFRFARTWWEPSPTELGKRWRTWNKGGGFSPYFRDIDLVIDWDSRRNTYRGYVGTIYRPDARPANFDYLFRAGLTWVYRGHRLCVQAMPAGTVISTRGNGLYSQHDLMIFDLGLLNSLIADILIKLSLGRSEHPQFDIGDVSAIPAPATNEAVAELAIRAWSLKRRMDTRVEASHAFTLPALLQTGGETFAMRATAWTEWLQGVHVEFAGIQAEIDERCFDLYGMDEADRSAISEAQNGEPNKFSEARDAAVQPAVSADGAIEIAVRETLAAELTSWAVGVAFGRFDVRIATHAQSLPSEPGPFDPLPACSPGMIVGDDGVPLTITPTGYPLTLQEGAVLVDDVGHARDLTRAVRSVFDLVFGGEADSWWSDVGMILGAKGGEVHSWLADGFFDHHLKVYSKSRRKAPILWPIGTQSGSYLVWLYAHRVSEDTLFQILSDLVVPKLLAEEGNLAQLRQDAGANPSASQRKAIEKQVNFVFELGELRETIEAVTPLWAPDLSDGTVIVLAPLWRLFRHHRTWSSELKKHWVQLTNGDYDWTQLAMRLWPDRVVTKCIKDRSLAISHDLEDVFWMQDMTNDGKWLPRQIPTTLVDELLAQRHYPAIAAALQRVNT